MVFLNLTLPMCSFDEIGLRKENVKMSELDKIDPDLGIEIYGPGRQYFDNVVIDNLMDAVVELSASVWTIRNRQIILEKILKSKGIDAESLIAAHIPDEAELSEKSLERDEMVNRIFRSFLRRPDDQVAQDANAPSLRDIKD